MKRMIFAFLLLFVLTATGCAAESLPPEPKAFSTQFFSSAGEVDGCISATSAEREVITTSETSETKNADTEISTEKTDLEHEKATSEAKISESENESSVPAETRGHESDEADKPKETQKSQILSPDSEAENLPASEEPSATESPAVTESPENDPPKQETPPDQPKQEESAPSTEPDPPVTTEPPKPTEPPVTEEPPAPEEPEPPKELTQADFDRIIAEVKAYAESYRDKGFTFVWKEEMEFSWDVGWFGTPRIRYEGIDGTIDMLKYHVDKIYRTGTDPKYGATSDSVTYKVVQITVDGDIAFAVIYGG